MQIQKDKVVQFKYILSDASESASVGSDTKNNFLEKSDDKAPVAYLHGHNNILAGLESELENKVVGDNFSVTLQPSKAYGDILPNKEQRISIKHLQGAKKWKKGMVGVVQTEKGNRQVTVVKVGKFMVTVDFNHPFAGKILKFDIEVINIREATGEEVAHGHAHGIGGHHH